MKSLQESILDIDKNAGLLDAELLINSGDPLKAYYSLAKKLKTDKKVKVIKTVPKEGAKGMFMVIRISPKSHSYQFQFANWQSDNWKENASVRLTYYSNGSINEAEPISWEPSDWADIKWHVEHIITKEEVSEAFQLPETKEYIDLLEDIIDVALKSGARGCQGLDMYKKIGKYKNPIPGIDWENPNDADAKKIQDWLESKGLMPHTMLASNQYMKYQIFKVIAKRDCYSFGYDRRIVKPYKKAIEGYRQLLEIYEKDCFAISGGSVVYKNEVGEPTWNAITAITDALGLKFVGDGQFNPK